MVRTTYGRTAIRVDALKTWPVHLLSFRIFQRCLSRRQLSITLVEGCLQGSFVLKVTRPDRSFRTWWRERPDDAALADPSLELVLPEYAELAEVQPKLLSSGTLRAFGLATKSLLNPFSTTSMEST